MLVLSRQIDETVMIGDSILVTVVAIEPEMTTLYVRFRDENQRVEQKLALEVDDRLEITNDIHVYVVDIRDDKVRLGVVAPKVFVVQRKEVYEATKRENAAATAVPPQPYVLKPNEKLLIGENLQLSLAAGDKSVFELSASGLLLGGSRDGEPFIRCESISVGSTLNFGTLVRVCVVSISPEGVGLKIDHPMHIVCRINK